MKRKKTHDRVNRRAGSSTISSGTGKVSRVVAFLCHSSHDSEFVIQVAQHLHRNLGAVFYYEEHQRADESFVDSIDKGIQACKVMVTFVGAQFSDWQRREVRQAVGLSRVGHAAKKIRKRKDFFVICLPRKKGGSHALPPTVRKLLEGYPHIKASSLDSSAAERVASEIVVRYLKLPWISADGLPLVPHLFDYEKDVIAFYMKKAALGARLYQAVERGVTGSRAFEEKQTREKMREKILLGCPSMWPRVEYHKSSDGQVKNKLDPEEVGYWRAGDARVLAATISSYHTRCMLAQGLAFPEAGPREHLHFSGRDGLRVAILVSGGIAPGINAVIDGIVQRHWMYAEKHAYANDLEVYGLQNGFQAFSALQNSYFLLTPREKRIPRELVTSEHANEGGSVLGTSRVEGLLDPTQRLGLLRTIVRQLRDWGIDILYVIGGDGSMRAAHAIWSTARLEGDRPLSVVAVPKTMDNDILWVWQAFGFLSAVEKAREIIEHLHTEVASNPRLCVVQLFGSDSGFVVSHAVLASATGHCDIALIPEVKFSMKLLATRLKKKMLVRHQRIPYGLVVMAETAIPTDAMRYVQPKEYLYDVGLSDDEEKVIRDFEKKRKKGLRIEGQTSDLLRSAGLKIVSRGLANLLPVIQVPKTGVFEPEWTKLRVFTNEPRHVLRAIRPSCLDIITGQRLGTLVVDNAMAGYTDFMISQWLTEYALVPLRLVILGRKRIPKSGIFWKSVLAKTGQGSLDPEENHGTKQ